MTTTFLTTGQVAVKLNLTRQGVVYRIDAGTLVPTAKLDGKTGGYLFDRDYIDALQVANGIEIPA